MSRRTKLTQAEREKRAAKRERRVSSMSERRSQQALSVAHTRFAQAATLYLKAVTEPVVSEVVCERCSLAQPYITDLDGDFLMSESGIVLCRREEFLGLSCDGEYAVTVEAFAEA